jgi:hypothetical protein
MSHQEAAAMSNQFPFIRAWLQAVPGGAVSFGYNRALPKAG